MAAKKNLFVRNPNIPVMAWMIGGTLHEVLIAGPGEYINMVHKSHGQWSPNSLITREYNQGVREVEHDLSDVGTWGWLGRYINGSIPRDVENATPHKGDIRFLMPTDQDNSPMAVGVGYLWGVFFDAKGKVVVPSSPKRVHERQMRLPPGTDFQAIAGKTFAEVEELYFAHYRQLRENAFKKAA
jgi:hypothetical protein